ncbi:twin-arginine translocase TatA/TatE family subunit [Listeria booriae]|uniref:Sec-independent protein translocase protein TatA n=1 Tax=Listeria booriae TaxID=1552123 RepID=A0A7X0YJC1_9LIST|nr:twin-arginine translocase TatA/TatE family subunit [Listeria booriae]MBC1372353.1 twin-arginine translocase TatA/TatE family subunit [Listeria booriae]MBC2115526.1 twin-arginine translocase TatA/TatE family subunit [Listeria booriae]
MALGPASIVLIVGAALVIFGPKKLPELGRAAGDTLREFKNATKGMMDDTKEQAAEPVKEDKEITK